MFLILTRYYTFALNVQFLAVFGSNYFPNYYKTLRITRVSSVCIISRVMIFVVIKCCRHDKFVLFSEERLIIIDVEWSRKSNERTTTVTTLLLKFSEHRVFITYLCNCDI